MLSYSGEVRISCSLIAVSIKSTNKNTGQIYHQFLWTNTSSVPLTDAVIPVQYKAVPVEHRIAVTVTLLSADTFRVILTVFQSSLQIISVFLLSKGQFVVLYIQNLSDSSRWWAVKVRTLV